MPYRPRPAIAAPLRPPPITPRCTGSTAGKADGATC
jgi:hypothetical protein